ncbi:hypothetical protein VKT23_018571 [Stygiomarasmius scandens]|uniref:Flavoprotein domain-containing protein n=1 Tax=Marasmiellus scandens TaxID=2682957 RepID=A0ABR1IRS1_9AGAR
MVSKYVQIVICAAGPAKDAATLIALAKKELWDIQVVATENAIAMLPQADHQALRDATGQISLRGTYATEGEQRRRADAIIVAPATVNTVSHMALVLCSNYVTSMLNEAIGKSIPIIVLPSLKKDISDRPAFRAHIESLREEGVQILLGEEYGGINPTNQSSKDGPLPPFPWYLAIDAARKAMGIQGTYRI